MAGLMALVAVSVQAGTYELVEITELSGPSEVWALNDDGDVVGWSDSQGWVFEDGQVIALTDLIAPPLPAGTTIRPFDITNGDRICGDLTFDGVTWGFLLNNRGIELLEPLSGTGQARPSSLNEAEVAVGSTIGGGQLGTLWFSGAALPLEPLPGFGRSSAPAINEAGIVVGTSFNFVPNLVGESHVTVWDSGAIVDLGVLPGYLTSGGVDINDAGQVAGRAGIEGSTAERRGFLREPDGSYVDLGGLPGLPFVTVTALNDHGDVVGYADDDEFITAFSAEGFVWQDGEMAGLTALLPDDSPWRITRAVDINDAGQIAAIAVPKDPDAPLMKMAVRLDPVVLVPTVTPAGRIVLVMTLLAGGWAVTRLRRQGSVETR